MTSIIMYLAQLTCVGMERLKGVVEVGEIYIDSKVVTNTLIKFNTTQRRVVF